MNSLFFGTLTTSRAAQPSSSGGGTPQYVYNYDQGSSNNDLGINNGNTDGSKITLSQGGTISEIGVWINYLNANSPTVKMALLNTSEQVLASGSVLVAGSISEEIDAYRSLTGLSVVVPAADYYIMFTASNYDSAIVSRGKSSSTNGDQKFDYDINYTTFPDGLNSLTNGTNPYPVRVYLTP